MNVSAIDWSRLMVFRAVADAGTISGAAEALAVSPAKVSRDVDELERSQKRYGLVTMCAAGGMAPAIIIERLDA